MAGKKLELVALTSEELREIPGFKTTPTFKAEFAKRARPAADAKTAQAKWLASVTAPEVEQRAPKAIKAAKLNAEALTKLRAVNGSTAPLPELIAQEMNPDDLLAVTYSALTTLAYIKMVSEKKQRLANAKNQSRRRHRKCRMGTGRRGFCGRLCGSRSQEP